MVGTSGRGKRGFAAPEIRICRFDNGVRTDQTVVVLSGETPPTGTGLSSHQKILNKAISQGHMNEVITVLKWNE